MEERELGPDGDLVASMISTAVIPLICKLVDGGALDVYSSKHIRRMVDLAEEVEASVEQGSGKFQVPCSLRPFGILSASIIVQLITSRCFLNP